MLELEAIKAIGEAIIWLKNLSDQEVKDVKDETQQLLFDLSKSLVILHDVTRKVSGLTDEQFKNGEFRAIFDHFKGIYYNNEYYVNAHTHCSDLERDVGSITLRLSLFLKAPLGKWKDASEELKFAVLEDNSVIEDFKKNFDQINQRLVEINNLMKESRADQSLEKYRQFRLDIKDDLDYLHEKIQNMRDADARIRRIV
jgi:hypothetical protein